MMGEVRFGAKLKVVKCKYLSVSEDLQSEAVVEVSLVSGPIGHADMLRLTRHALMEHWVQVEFFFPQAEFPVADLIERTLEGMNGDQ